MNAYSKTYPPISGGGEQVSYGTVIPFSVTKDVGLERVTINNPSGFGGYNAFGQDRRRVDGGLVSGSWSRSQGPVTYSNVPCNAYDNRGYQNWPVGLGNGPAAARLLANTNPTRPDIQLPVFILELRDIPKMIEHAGALLLRLRRGRPRFGLRPDQEAASALLAYNFGWAPLIGDLKKLVSFSDLTAKRMKEFDRLYSGPGLKRRMNLDTAYSQPHGFTYGVAGPNPGNSVTAQGLSRTIVWGTVRWKPTPAPLNSPLRVPPPSDVRRHVLGLSAANITANVWEALPWSWLIDYFVNVGDVLAAKQGRSVATPSLPCIMRKSTTYNYGPSMFFPQNALGEGITFGDMRQQYEKKERNVVSGGSIFGSFSDLSGRQLSILGALASLKVLTGANGFK